MIKEQRRLIRSFVRRDSRITSAQQHAFKTVWPHYGLSVEAGMIDYHTIFQREASCVLEIGFGSGYSLFETAKHYPEQNFIGIETYLPGIGAILLQMKAMPMSNIRLYYADAIEVLTHAIPDHSLSAILIFFPDPWPKRKHHKRRLIQPVFVELLVSKLKKAGELHIATDCEDYAKHIMQVLSNTTTLTNRAGMYGFSDRSTYRLLITKFEKRGLQAKQPIWDLHFIK